MSISPDFVVLDLDPGESATEAKTALIGVPQYGAIDVMFLIDETGSMSVQPNWIGIADNTVTFLNIALGSGFVHYAVAFFKDYCTPAPGPYPDCGCENGIWSGDPDNLPINLHDYPEYRLAQAMTNNYTNVYNAIATGNPTDGGGDAPEGHNYAFQRTYTDGSIAWRTGSRRYVVLISDAEPHGAGSSAHLVPGCTDNGCADPHGLIAVDELDAMRAAKETLIAVYDNESLAGASSSIYCFEGMASLAFAGGAGFSWGQYGSAVYSHVVSQIVSSINVIDEVHLEVISASPPPADASWITLPPAIGPITSSGTYALGNVTVTVPGDTPGGVYTFELAAYADGVDIGHQTLVVRVGEAGVHLPPQMLV